MAWLDHPLRLYVAPAPRLTPYPTTAPPCRAGRLRVSQGRGGVGLGNELTELVFTNLGPGPCVLRGYPTISATTADGARQELSPRHGGTYFGQLSAADLPVGGHVFLDFGTGDGCAGGLQPAVHYHELVFTLPQGGDMAAGPGVSVIEDCGFLDMSVFGLQQRYSTSLPAAAGSVAALTARLASPQAVRAGRTLSFTVVLDNPTAHAVRLNPCPGYSEGIYASGLVVRHSFALDCEAMRAIAAHVHVRYEMELAVPGGAPPGIAKLDWSLDDAQQSPSTGGVVRVLAR